MDFEQLAIAFGCTTGGLGATYYLSKAIYEMSKRRNGHQLKSLTDVHSAIERQTAMLSRFMEKVKVDHAVMLERMNHIK